MDTNVIFQTSTAITAATITNRFAALYYMGAGAFSATANLSSQSVMPIAGTIKNLYVANDNAPGAGTTRTFAVYLNGVQQSLAVTLSGASQTTGNDTTHTVAFNAGDTISYITNGTGSTAATGNIRITVAITATNTSCVMAVSGAAMNTAGNSFIVVQSQGKDNTATNVEAVMPTDGVLKNANAVLNGAPTTGNGYTATLFQNGLASAITFSITDLATTGNDTTHTVTVAAGDRLYWQFAATGTPTGRQVMVSMEFAPTVSGESVHMFGGNTAQTTTAARFQTIAAAGGGAFSTGETAKEALTQAVTWKKLNIFEQTQLLAGTYQYQPQYNALSGNITVTANTSAQAFNDTTNTDSSNVGDTISMKITPATSPTSSIVEWGIVSFIAPPVTATAQPSHLLASMGVGR